MEFVQRIDSLFQESILVCVQSSLDKFLHLLTGSGSFRADPIINFGVTINGPAISFDPPLSHIEQFLQSLLLHLSDLFMVNFSLWKKFETEKSVFVRDGLKANAINRRILECKYVGYYTFYHSFGALVSVFLNGSENIRLFDFQRILRFYNILSILK